MGSIGESERNRIMENTTKIQALFDPEDLTAEAKIKVIGVGGGGSNAVNGMLGDKSNQVEYWVLNTDSQALSDSPCHNKLVLGRNTTKGLGAGGDPEKGRMAAEDSIDEIKQVVSGADLVFLACGEGGGTGTGAAPVVAQEAKEAGALVLAIVTRPFNFEGDTRSNNALEGIQKLKAVVDALIVVSNDKLNFNNADVSFEDALAKSDQVLASSVKTVTDLILKRGRINLDFADVKATLTGKGLSLIGIGYGEGKNKAFDAATNAVNSPLLEASIRGAKSMIVNFTIGKDTTMKEIQYAVSVIKSYATGKQEDSKVNIIFGVQSDPDFVGKMKIAIIATDFVKDYDFSKTSPLPEVDLEHPPVFEEDKKPENNASDTPLAPQEDDEDDSFLADYLKQAMQDKPATEDMPMEKEEKKEETKDTSLASEEKIYR